MISKKKHPQSSIKNEFESAFTMIYNGKKNCPQSVG
jgi:hypothetical protein